MNPTNPVREAPTDRDYHYGEFYRLKEPPQTSGPRVAVVGNCQGESLRILLASSGAVASYRVPPIHEWAEADLPFVEAALAETDVLISQPVRDDYRGLPCGTDQLARLLPEGGRVITYPVLRFNALNPAIAIIRSPKNPSLNPPVVPYHNLKYLAEHAGLERTGEPDYRACLAQTIEQLASRERAHDCVTISDTLNEIPVWHILNHPSNETLIELARRVLRVIDPEVSAEALERIGADFELLGHLQAPIDPDAAAEFGVDVHCPTWTLDGEPIDELKIRAEQLRFYEENPEVVQAGLTRHRELLGYLGYAV